MFLLIALFCYFLICNPADFNCFANMGDNLLLSFEAPVKMADEVHRVDKVRIQWVDISSSNISAGYFGSIKSPLFNCGPDSKFSDLSSFLASADEPSVQSRDTTGNDGTNPSSKNGSTGYIELHDFITILSGFIFGYVVVSILIYLI
jgi:hypothetical protein